jgi:hypothetical protein
MNKVLYLSFFGQTTIIWRLWHKLIQLVALSLIRWTVVSAGICCLSCANFPHDVGELSSHLRYASALPDEVGPYPRPDRSFGFASSRGVKTRWVVMYELLCHSYPHLRVLTTRRTGLSGVRVGYGSTRDRFSWQRVLELGRVSLNAAFRVGHAWRQVHWDCLVANALALFWTLLMRWRTWFLRY